MGIILLLIVIVAAFNIISTLVMVVTDKTREIGILKSMGLNARAGAAGLHAAGVVIGTVGSLLGALAGLFLTWLLDRYQFIRDPGRRLLHRPSAGGLRPGRHRADPGRERADLLPGDDLPGAAGGALFPVEAIRHE
jgi:lipoprotein-releasing system permease protein